MRIFLLCLSLVTLGGIASAQVDRGAPLPRSAALGIAMAAGEKGVRITSVAPGLTAAKLAVQAEDILVRMNGTEVKQPAQVAALMRSLKANSDIKLEIERAGKPLTLTGKMVARPLVTEENLKVVYDQVKVGDRRIRVIFTHPEGKGPFPTLFLIGGIGAYSIDGPFATSAYGNVMGPIARAGYATVRMDKPGQGDSEGPMYTDLLFEDELSAYVATLKLAKTVPFIDKAKIAVFGHSMGGTFGPLMFAQEPFAALAVNGTLAKTWYEYQIENTRRQIMLSGTPAGEADQFMRPFAVVNHLLFAEQWSIEKIKKERPDLASFLGEISPDGKTLSGVGVPFFQQLAQRNLGEAWSKVTVPTLVTYGENDFISGEEDHRMIRDFVNTTKPGLAEFVKLKNSDHGFNETSSFRDSMTRWGQPGAKFNPNIATTLKDWLDRTLKPVG